MARSVALDAAKKKASQMSKPEAPLSKDKLKKLEKASRAKGPFVSPGDLVLCSQKKVLYDAKVLLCEINPATGVFEYFVHYRNYRQRYDEWVTQERLRLDTPQNRIEQSEMRQLSQQRKHVRNLRKQQEAGKEQDDDDEHETKSDDEASSSQPDKTGSMDACKKKKSLLVNDKLKHLNAAKVVVPEWVESYQEYAQRQEYRIPMPEELNFTYITDAELIMSEGKLLALPPRHASTVFTILRDFYAAKTSRAGVARETLLWWSAFTKRIYFQFNLMLVDASQCIYEPELDQYELLRKHYHYYQSPVYTPTMMHYEHEYNKLYKLKKKRSRNTMETGGEDNSPDDSLPTPLSDPVYAPVCDSIEDIDDVPRDYTRLYGAHHLVRFFRRLGEYMQQTEKWQPSVLNKFFAACKDFLRWLAINLHYFGDENNETMYIDANDWKEAADIRGRAHEAKRIWMRKIYAEMQAREEGSEDRLALREE